MLYSDIIGLMICPALPLRVSPGPVSMHAEILSELGEVKKYSHRLTGANVYQITRRVD